jgi:hypothetical protein
VAAGEVFPVCLLGDVVFSRNAHFGLVGKMIHLDAAIYENCVDESRGRRGIFNFEDEG